MRNNRDFRVATRTILREINREMMPNLIRERRPIFPAAETSLSTGICTTAHPQAIRLPSVRILHWRLLTC